MGEGGISTETQEKIQLIKSFKTAQGSVYTYDGDGKTTRFKTATKEQKERQDITIFVNLTPDEEEQVLHAYRHPLKEDEDSSVHIVERQQDNMPTYIKDIKDVVNPDRICLGVLNRGKWALVKKASITPIVGYNVFDTRDFQKDGQRLTEKHLGNKVTEIEYAE